MEKKKVIIIGGGAAGMMAAISAKYNGAEVIILEKNPRVGKKILATGNGRCNFTNVSADATCFSGSNPKFVYSTLSEFSIEDTLKFFNKLGIEYKIEDLGKAFPMSDQASSILDVLLYELNYKGINIVCDANVKGINKKGHEFIVRLENGKEYISEKVIITTGGKAMPSSGSDGSGYELAQKLGHSITDVFPALVQIMLDGQHFKRIDGVKLVGTSHIIHKGKSIVMDRGDILFTNYGVSGPPILQISRKAGELLNQKEDAYVKLDMLDTMSLDEVRAIINRRFENNPHKTVEFSLVGLINKRLIPVVLLEAGIEDLKRPVSALSTNEVERIIKILKDWRFKIRGTKSWSSAQVTAGGVATKDIDPKTMESKLVKGLYFAGEILDVDGKCGGFNLQWAWSSGFVAGSNSAAT